MLINRYIKGTREISPGYIDPLDRPEPTDEERRIAASAANDAARLRVQERQRYENPDRQRWENNLRDAIEEFRRSLGIMHDFNRSLAEARGPLDNVTKALEDARDRVAGAAAALGEFDAAHSAAISQWSIAGAAERPSIDIERRRALEAVATIAQAELSTIEASFRYQSDAFNEKRQRGTHLSTAMNMALVNILFAEAELLGEDVKIKLIDLAATFSSMFGLNEVLQRFGSEATGHVMFRPIVGAVNPPAIALRSLPLWAVQFQSPIFWLECFGQPGMPKFEISRDAVAAAHARWECEITRLMSLPPDDDQAKLEPSQPQNPSRSETRGPRRRRGALSALRRAVTTIS